MKSSKFSEVLELVKRAGILRPRDLDSYGIPREYFRRLYRFYLPDPNVTILYDVNAFFWYIIVIHCDINAFVYYSLTTECNIGFLSPCFASLGRDVDVFAYYIDAFFHDSNVFAQDFI
jgi:hypothetical protein